MAKAINWGSVNASTKRRPQPATPPSRSVMPIPQFWINNIEKLKHVLHSGTVYFDLIARPDSFSIMVSAVKFGHPEYKDYSMELFLIYRDKNMTTTSAHHLGSFIEPACVASVLTLQGFEVYYSIAKHASSAAPTEEIDDDKYMSFSETIFSLATQEKQDKLNSLLGGTYLGNTPAVSNSSPPVFAEYSKYLSKEELEG
jgi:hypothetical protein